MERSEQLIKHRRDQRVNMNLIAFAVLRRMRKPCIVLICVYAVVVLGYVLIPGEDANGDPVQVSFFEAFYFVSYMATTIGFGELPNFSNGQRLWTMASLYATVIGWLYGFGSLLGLLRDPQLSSVLKRHRFRLRVKAFNDPFALVVGYGLTAADVVRKLADQGMSSVVIERDPARALFLEMEHIAMDAAVLVADGKDPGVLLDAGLNHPNCEVVLCLTRDDHTNLSVSIASKILNPTRPVVSRVASPEYARNLESFKTDFVLSPNLLFADTIRMAIDKPFHYLVRDWLVSDNHRPMASAYQRRQGTWVICGYNELGRPLYRQLRDIGIEVVIIDPDPEGNGTPSDCKVVKGLGTEAGTLMMADIQSAVGVVACTNDDPNNLSIILTARDLNSNLITVSSLNEPTSHHVYCAAAIDMVLDPTEVLSNQILVCLKTPLLMQLMESIDDYDEAWCRRLLYQLFDRVGSERVDTWSIHLDEKRAPAVDHYLANVGSMVLGDLSREGPQSLRAPCIPLLLVREGQSTVLPEADMVIKRGDEVLFAGKGGERQRMLWMIENNNVMEYVMTGRAHSSIVWSWLRRKRLGISGIKGALEDQ